MPAPTAANAAAPAAVASTAAALDGDAGGVRLQLEQRVASRVSPPSTRSTSTGDRLADGGEDVRHPPGDRLERGASRRARAASPESARRSTARASGFHHGAPTPASAGSTRTPPASDVRRDGGERRRVGREAQVSR